MYYVIIIPDPWELPILKHLGCGGGILSVPLPSSILKSSYTRDAREDGAQIFTGLNIKINRITYIISLLFGRTPYVSNAHVTVVLQTNEHIAENKHNILKLILKVCKYTWTRGLLVFKVLITYWRTYIYYNMIKQWNNVVIHVW